MEGRAPFSRADRTVLYDRAQHRAGSDPSLFLQPGRRKLEEDKGFLECLTVHKSETSGHFFFVDLRSRPILSFMQISSRLPSETGGYDFPMVINAPLRPTLKHITDPVHLTLKSVRERCSEQYRREKTRRRCNKF